MSDPLGPTGNTDDVCVFCGEAHDAMIACKQLDLRNALVTMKQERDEARGVARELFLCEFDLLFDRENPECKAYLEAAPWLEEEAGDE